MSKVPGSGTGVMVAKNSWVPLSNGGFTPVCSRWGDEAAGPLQWQRQGRLAGSEALLPRLEACD